VSDGAAVLLDVGQLGGFFAVETSLGSQPWDPMAALVDGSAALGAQIARVQAALAAPSGIVPDAVERRVAASIMQQSLMAWLVSPALAGAAIAGWVPRMQLARMWWQPTQPSPTPIALPDPNGQEARTSEQLAQLISVLVIDEAVADLVTAIELETQLSPHISWGNVASSLVGATTVLSRQRPDVAAAAAAICRGVLRTHLLSDAGDFEPSGRFRRNSCCLYYRLPHGGLCGDCVLAS
jgi:hypothetical protein